MAGFNTAITGIRSASTDLDVIGNNIANSSTVGFKSSRTEFGDIYATAVVGAGSSNVAGSGVTVTDIAQDFQAGTIQFTNNNLDLAINGSGFFQLDDGQGGVTYTRAGSFELDREGFIVSKNGKRLQGFGLDAEGNRLPIGDLAVTQTSSPPQATSEIDLSFNINDGEDATTLAQPYDRNNPSSFTFSTTLRSFDSLGNEHTIKYDLVEQPPIREVQALDFSGPGMVTGVDGVRISGVNVSLEVLQKGVGINPDLNTLGRVNTVTVTDPTTAAINDITINGVNLALSAAVPGGSTAAAAVNQVINDADAIVANYNANLPVGQPQLIDIVRDPTNTGGLLFRYENGVNPPSTAITLSTAGVAVAQDDFQLEVQNIITGDPRINSISIGGTNGDQINLRFNSSATDVDAVQVRNNSGVVRSDVLINSTNLASNEVHTYSFSDAAFDPVSGGLLTETQITIGGVDIQLQAGATRDTIAGTIASSQAAIVDANPDVSSVQFDASNNLVIQFDADAGNVQDGVLAVEFGTTPVLALTDRVNGDRSFQGVYRMYAYLNGTDQLNLGKAVDPGEPGTTEPGPILIQFNPSNGLLSQVNGISVPIGGNAPPVTILGADPANPDDPNATITLGPYRHYSVCIQCFNCTGGNSEWFYPG